MHGKILIMDSPLFFVNRSTERSFVLLLQVRIWDTESKSCICMAAGHMGAVGAVAFSKKAKNFFVSGSRLVESVNACSGLSLRERFSTHIFRISAIGAEIENESILNQCY